MAILVKPDTKVLVQGITGKIGQAQTKWMKEYGTNIVAGVTPGRGGAAGAPAVRSDRDRYRTGSDCCLGRGALGLFQAGDGDPKN